MLLRLLLIPALCSAFQCFYARIRFKCAKDEYWGPVVVELYDERSFIFGGDLQHWKKFQNITIGEYKGIFEINYKTDYKCPEPFNPYLVITSYCELPDESEKGVIRGWVDYFKSKFAKENKKILKHFQHGPPLTTCRRIPAINNWTEIPIQLHAEDNC